MNNYTCYIETPRHGTANGRLSDIISNYYNDIITLVDSDKKANLVIGSQTYIHHENNIVWQTPWASKRKNMRTHRNNDQHYYTWPNITFTFGDAIAPNIIGVPLSYNVPDSISQPEAYWTSYHHKNTEKYHGGKIFWGGRETHVSRDIIKELNKIDNNKQLNCNIWVPVGKNPRKRSSPYIANKPNSIEYLTYFKKLQNCDISLLIRGDKTWCYSFFDMCRAGTAIALIDTEYQNLGWHHLGYDVNDLFLTFDTSKDSPEYIYNTLCEVANDKERILKMKATLADFYTKYIMTDRLDNKQWNFILGWGDFFIAKLLQIYQNDFELVDTCFFSPNIHQIKSL